MKYLCLSLCILFFLPVALFGQHYIGVGGGGGTPNKIGLRLSLPMSINLVKRLSLQPELVYVEQGTSQILRKLMHKDYRSSQAAFIALPVLLKAGVEFEQLNLYLLAGPRFAYGVRLSANYLTDTGYFHEKLDFQEVGLQKFDLGAIVGIGLEKIISKDRKIFIDFRYYLGLLDLDQDPNRVIYPEGFYVNIGLFLPLAGQVKN